MEGQAEELQGLLGQSASEKRRLEELARKAHAQQEKARRPELGKKRPRPAPRDRAPGLPGEPRGASWPEVCREQAAESAAAAAARHVALLAAEAEAAATK